MTIDDDLAAWIAGLDDLFALVAGLFSVAIGHHTTALAVHSSNAGCTGQPTRSAPDSAA